MSFLIIAAAIFGATWFLSKLLAPHVRRSNPMDCPISEFGETPEQIEKEFADFEDSHKQLQHYIETGGRGTYFYSGLFDDERRRQRARDPESPPPIKEAKISKITLKSSENGIVEEVLQLEINR